MIVLLLNGTKKSTKAYKKRLAGYGVQLLEKKVDLSDVPWDGRYPSKAWFEQVAIQTYKEYEFSIDVFQILFNEKDWKSDDVSLRGVHLGTPRNGYEIGAFWARDKWGDTGAHELGHAMDDFVYTYSGKNLGRLVGVDDWDDEIVHKKNKKGQYTYDYGVAFQVAQKHVDEACRARDALVSSAASLYKQIGYTLRVSSRKLVDNTKVL